MNPVLLRYRRPSTFAIAVCAAIFGGLLSSVPAVAQEAAPAEAPAAESPVETPADDSASVEEKATEAVGEIAQQIDQDERAQEVSAGILDPIYRLAEAISFPAIHWIAFAIMATGVVSFALQLVLAKLAVLMRGSLSFKEILSDVLGLVISLLGLVLTTQAAAENSTFTTSPAAVLSASGAGVIVGFVFYLWGQSQELQAARGRKVE